MFENVLLIKNADLFDTYYTMGCAVMHKCPIYSGLGKQAMIILFMYTLFGHYTTKYTAILVSH